MSERHAFERDPYLTEIATSVVGAGETDGRPWVVLADTVLYPEGGGQPADHGTVDGVAVTDVRRSPEGIRHLLAEPVASGGVTVRLDWDRRFDHMQQHTAQHLLTAVAQDRFGWPTTAFHLGADVSDVELDTTALPPAAVADLEEAVAAEVRAARPVCVSWIEPAELAGAGVRTRGLPDGHTGPVRLVEIVGIDRNTCGGTHVRSTAELEAVALLGTEPMRGGTRLHFVAGRRMRALLRRHETRGAALRATLQAPDDELVDVAAAKLAALDHTARALRRTEEELADAVAASLAATGTRTADAHLGLREVAFLQRVGRRFAELRPDALALLTADAAAGGALFVVAAGADTGIDLRAAGTRVAERLGGRGGGAGVLFQGKTPSLAARADALADLAAALGAAQP